MAEPSSVNSGALSAIVRGGLGFALVSLAAFSVWAFFGRWFHTHGGEIGLFVMCAAVFLGASGLFLHPLIHGPRRFLRFYKIFIPAFLAYAILWSAAWFIFQFGLGEWLGSFLGSAAFAVVVAFGFKNYQAFAWSILFVFIFHSAGYFLGGKLMSWMTSPAGATTLYQLSKSQLSLLAKLLWGLLYGLGFGIGIGFTFHSAQRRATL